MSHYLEQGVRATDANPMMVREGYLAPRIVFVDGLPGCGKTMLSPIVGALPRVQIIQYAYEVEYICALYFLKKMERDAARALVRLFTDLKLYNVMMSRETNFRLSDISGVFRNAKRWHYFLRLVQKGDEAVIPRIQKGRPILHLTTHHVLPFGEPIDDGLGSRALVVEVIRHPLYMIRQQVINFSRYGTDPRMFTLCFDYHGKGVPYFVKGWEELYLASNPWERAIYMIHHLWKRVHQFLSDKKRDGVQVLEIPFERYVLAPWAYMKQLEELLGVAVNTATRRQMKKQRVPRERIADGLALPIYKKYGWRPPLKGTDESGELLNRRADVEKKASPEAMRVLDFLSHEYEEKYLKGVLV